MLFNDIKHLTKILFHKYDVKTYKYRNFIFKIPPQISLSKNFKLFWLQFYSQTVSLFLIFSDTFNISVIIPLEIACLQGDAL